MKRNFALMLLVLSVTYFASAQCSEDTTFEGYHYLCPEMLHVADSVINIKTHIQTLDSLQSYRFMYYLDNDQIHQKNTPESMFASRIIWTFMTHRLKINGLLFTGSLRIAQKYVVWGVENMHSGLYIMEIQYEKGKIIRKEKLPDPTADPREEMKMW